MSRSKNNDTKIEKKQDKRHNKTIIREVETETTTSSHQTGKLSSLRSRLKNKLAPPPEEVAPPVETAPQKKLFLSPEGKNITKNTDGVIADQKQPIKMRPHKAKEAETVSEEEPYVAKKLLNVSPDRQEAYLMVYKKPDGEVYTKEELLTHLAENGITFGIIDSAIEDIAAGKHYYEDVLVAKGISPRDGRDGYYEFHFNPDPETKPIVMGDGSVDYNTLGKIELVVPDQLLITYHVALPCRTGTDVYGTTISATEGVNLPPLKCKNCELDEENQYEYYATAEGNATYEDGHLTVTPVYIVEGDLEAATGDVNFHGDVLVRGNVFANVTIKTTGSITIDGHVEVANLYAGKDVLLKNGMQGAGIGRISAKGSVFAKFLEQTHVYAGNEINTNALLNCEVEAGKTIVVTGKRGSIIGGTTVAAEQITAFSLGNRVGVHTKLVVGLEKEFKIMMEELDKETDTCNQNLRDAEMTLDRITYQQHSGTPLSPELTQQRTESMRAKIKYQSQLSELNTKRGHFMHLNEHSAEAKIVISGPAYPGCHVIINGIFEDLRSECRDVTFRKNKREIRILSNKL